MSFRGKVNRKEMMDGKKRGCLRFWKALENRDLSNMIKESKRYSEGKELASRNKKTRETLELLYEYGYNRK